MGGATHEVQGALEIVDCAGSARACIADALHHSRRNGGFVAQLPIEARLALEMSLQEENERRALEAELAQLEQAWREAEEIAEIADNLLLPADVVERIAGLREARLPRRPGFVFG